MEFWKKQGTRVKGASTSQVIVARNEMMMDDTDGQIYIRGPCVPKAS